MQPFTNLVLFPKADDLPTLNQSLIMADDYYGIFLEAAFIARDETFWTKNLVGVTISMAIGGQKPISLPIYSNRAVHTSGHLAINHQRLMMWVPSFGRDVGIGASLVRFDKDDTIKRILGIVGDAQKSTELTTYAAQAVPYVALAALVGNEIYGAVGPKDGQDILFSTEPTTLAPNTGSSNRYDLRDCYMLQYFGPDNMDDDALRVHDGDVYWSNGTRLQSGPWFLFRIQKYPRRLDRSDRPWQKKFDQEVLGELNKITPDLGKAQKAYEDIVAILEADPDFTPRDKNMTLQEFKKQVTAKTPGAADKIMRGVDQEGVFLNGKNGDLALPPDRSLAKNMQVLGFN
jgi:hypothetical protein